MPITWAEMHAYSSLGLHFRAGEYWGYIFREWSLTEDHNLVGGGKVKTRAACQCRNKKDEYVCFILKSIDQRHACVKRQMINATIVLRQAVRAHGLPVSLTHLI